MSMTEQELMQFVEERGEKIAKLMEETERVNGKKFADCVQFLYILMQVDRMLVTERGTVVNPLRQSCVHLLRTHLLSDLELDSALRQANEMVKLSLVDGEVPPPPAQGELH